MGAGQTVVWAPEVKLTSPTAMMQSVVNLAEPCTRTESDVSESDMTVQPTSLRSALPEKSAAADWVLLRARMQALAAVCMYATALTLSTTLSSKKKPVK